MLIKITDDHYLHSESIKSIKKQRPYCRGIVGGKKLIAEYWGLSIIISDSSKFDIEFENEETMDQEFSRILKEIDCINKEELIHKAIGVDRDI